VFDEKHVPCSRASSIAIKSNPGAIFKQLVRQAS
jgi:hypothetical protein